MTTVNGRAAVLVIGCGDVGERTLPLLVPRYEVVAVSRHRLHAAALDGVRRVTADLDLAASLMSIEGLIENHYDAVIHLVPPPNIGTADMRTRTLIATMLAQRPRRFVYVSTTGVYGDCGGEWVDESRRVAPQTDRARRRVDAEQALLDWGAASGVRVSILRVPGIYAADRLPLERLRQGTPALLPEDDVFTNHIHADDLAAIIVAALEQGEAGAIYNASDDTEMKMGEYFDLIADRAGLPRPRRISRELARTELAPLMFSFMSESRRLVNTRMKRGLGVQLRYPTVREGIPASITASK
jgi:nucleoside-diphosphate-sugar epimerase